MPVTNSLLASRQSSFGARRDEPSLSSGSIPSRLAPGLAFVRNYRVGSLIYLRPASPQSESFQYTSCRLSPMCSSSVKDKDLQRVCVNIRRAEMRDRHQEAPLKTGRPRKRNDSLRDAIMKVVASGRWRPGRDLDQRPTNALRGRPYNLEISDSTVGRELAELAEVDKHRFVSIKRTRKGLEVGTPSERRDVAEERTRCAGGRAW